VVVLVWLLYEALSPRLTPKQSFALLTLIVVSAMIGTLNRITVWQTAENLWADTVEKNPRSGRAQNNLALIYMQRAEYGKAIEHLDLCEQYWPSYMYCALNKGIIGLSTKNSELAEKSLNRAMALDPQSPWVNFHLGRFFNEYKKDSEHALQFFMKADELTGNRYLDAKEWIARIQLDKGNRERARALASEILQLQPNRPTTRDLLNRLSQAQ
jgi:tetratricopeptide (TPR) repeat protein